MERRVKMKKGLTGKRFMLVLVVHKKGREEGTPHSVSQQGKFTGLPPTLSHKNVWTRRSPTVELGFKMGQPCQPPVVLSNRRLQVWHELESGQVPRVFQSTWPNFLKQN